MTVVELVSSDPVVPFIVNVVELVTVDGMNIFCPVAESMPAQNIPGIRYIDRVMLPTLVAGGFIKTEIISTSMAEYAKKPYTANSIIDSSGIRLN